MLARLRIESLESRELPSGGLVVGKPELSASAAIVRSGVIRSVEVAYSRTTGLALDDTPIPPALKALVAPFPLAQRWDKVVVGSWYVPPANMLAYLVGPEAANPLAVADQTIFQITRSRNGDFSGGCSVHLAKATPQGTVYSSPTTYSIQGLVTVQGQVRIQFTPVSSGEFQTPVTGIGYMKWVNNAWRMTMQMASGGSLKGVHWAYMAKVPPGRIPPRPVVQPPGDTPPAGYGRWLLGTRWLITDSSGITGPGPAEFEINGYRKGYFLGESQGQAEFAVFGSVTPEGNLFLLFVSRDGTNATRTGTMKKAGSSWVMLFRSYEGQAESGRGLLLGRNRIGSLPNRL